MILCQSTMCFGEDLIDTEVYAQTAGITVESGKDIVVSGDGWNSFSAKKSSLTVNTDGSATFVPGGSGSSAGRSELITAELDMPLISYEEAVIKVKYTNVSGVTSRAEKEDSGYYVPTVRAELVCSVDGGTQTKVLTGKAVSGAEGQTYTTDGYVDVALKISDIEGYESLTATTINIYPMYGFKTGTVDMESITVKYVETGSNDTPGDSTDEQNGLVWNFDTAAEVAQWASNSASQVKVSHDAAGYMKYVSTVTSSSGWVTTPVEFPGGKYNKLKYRAKIENYTPTIASTALDNPPFLEMYYSCINANGESQGPKGGYSITRSYQSVLGGDGLYSGDWAEYEIDLTKLRGWNEAQTITQIRLDIAKNASGTVYMDYIQLCYEEPVVEPEPPVVEPDEPEIPDEPDVPAEPVIEGEQWYSNYFDTEADVSKWVAKNNKDQATVTWVEGGYMKYVSTPTTNAAGVQQSGWAITKVEFDGNQYYKLKMRAKVENYERSFSGGQAPFFTIYYQGKNASGADQSYHSNYAMNISYQASEDENGLFNSDWVDYEIDLGNLKGWDTMKEINEFRIDFAKNAAGTVYFDYINFLSLPAINSLTYDDTEGADMQKVPVDARTIEAYISQPLNTITAKDIAIYEKSDDAEKAYVGISDVKYTTSTGKIVATLSEEMLSDTEYVFEIRDTAMANSKQTLYRPVGAQFRTDASSFEVEITDLGDGSALVKYINTGATKNVALIATAWSGTKYMGKTILPVSAENGITEELIDFSSLGGDKAEIITWEFKGGVPKVYGKKVVEIVG